MNSALRLPYSIAGRVADAFTAIVPAGDSKFRRGLSARRGIVDRYRSWAATHRDPSRPLAWFHAPSVGEGLQALPVIDLLRQRRRDLQIAYTFYSPSAERFAQSIKADFTDYLPFDRFDHSEEIVAALRPSALIFSKLDVWPALTEVAAASDTRIGVISATLAEGSARRGPFARALLNDAYAALDRVGAIDKADAERLQAQGVRHDRITVTGDTRYDQVWLRAQKAAPSLVRALRSSRPTLVAGSTWPADEAQLFPAWLRIGEKIPDARLIIAPHEINVGHLASITKWARNRLRLSRIDSPDATDADVLLVDRFGILGDLYALADVAFVGGAFHAAGLHSVLEPAAFGAPVLFGPRYDRSRDAVRLIAAGGGAAVKSEIDLAIRLADWLGSIAARDTAAAAAKAMVQEGLGAAERSYQLVTTLLPP